jgi:hypothetical protein
MLHQQGDQITRTHNMVVDTEKDLSKVCLSCFFYKGLKNFVSGL